MCIPDEWRVAEGKRLLEQNLGFEITPQMEETLERLLTFFERKDEVPMRIPDEIALALYEAARDVRDKQKEYFKTRLRDDLRASKEAEKRLDDILKVIRAPKLS